MGGCLTIDSSGEKGEGKILSQLPNLRSEVIGVSVSMAAGCVAGQRGTSSAGCVDRGGAPSLEMFHKVGHGS